MLKEDWRCQHRDTGNTHYIFRGDTKSRALHSIHTHCIVVCHLIKKILHANAVSWLVEMQMIHEGIWMEPSGMI